MKKITLVMLLALLAALSPGFAQTLVSWETFPNSFNSGYTRQINGTFQGSIGIWNASASDYYATVAVNYSGSSNALQMVNYNTSGSGNPSTSMAISPVVTCNTTCIGSSMLSFSLYTNVVYQSNTSLSLYVEVTADGVNWTSVYSKTAQELYNMFGSGTWNNINVSVPVTYLTANFRYRIRTTENPYCGFDNSIYISNIKFTTYPCNTNNLRLGNMVWNDVNLNGVRDAGEPAIVGATVNLYKDDNNDNVADGAPIKSTVTDNAGMYLFTGLAAGNYIVGVVIPNGNIRGPQSFNDPDDNIDNDNNGSVLVGNNGAGGEVRSYAITLADGTEPTTDGDDASGNLTLDIALCQGAPANNLTLGNAIWRDVNCNGYKDPSEPGVPNVKVYLYRDNNNDNIADSNAIKETMTDAYGMYKFTDLAPGNYITGIVIPNGYMASTTSPNDPDNNIDNDNNGNILLGNNWAGSKIRTYAITLSAGDEPTTEGDDANGNNTLDIGLCVAPTNILSLGNLIWRDNNANGVRDAGEPGIAGISVYLYTDNNGDNIADSNAIRETTTDANGMYKFSNLEPGNYLIGVVIPQGLVRGYIGNAPNDPDNNIDDDNNGTVLLGQNQAGSKVRTYAITLAAGTEPTTDGDDANSNLTLDIGLCPAPQNVLSLGNLVWNDKNLNGVRDAGEPGIAGAAVKLYKDDNNDNVADGVAIRTTTTDTSGMYRFTSLEAGNYIVGVVIPTGNVRGPQSFNDPDDNVDNDNNGAVLVGNNTAGGEVRSYAITLAPGTEPTYDGDDANGNQTLDIALCESAQQATLRLGNMVYYDANLNNMRDAGEPGVPGATVKLYKDDNNDNVVDGSAIMTTTTDANGYYMFNNLSAGNYIVGLVLPSGYIKGPQTTTDPDNDVDNDNNGVNLLGNNSAGGEVRSLAITLQAGTEPTYDGDDNNGNLTLDFGLCKTPPTVKIGNFVWLDQNCNGMKDAGEQGISGVTVRLYKDDNNDNIADGAAVQTATTNSLGYYYFSGLAQGNYIVGVVIPSGTQVKTFGIDPDNDVDNDNNVAVVVNGNSSTGGEVRSLAITLTPGTEPDSDGDDANSNFTVDFGFCPAKLKVGNFVWIDQNCNGMKDAGETGVGNATVRLYKDDNNDNVADGAAIQTSTTNASGYYYFSGLDAGNYIVGVTIPSGCGQGYVAGTATDPDNDVDNDNNGVVLIGANQPGSEVRSYAITLVAGTEPTIDGDDANSNFTLDFGLCPVPQNILKLGNLVWLDQNCNGLKDPTENGIANVTVKLYKDDNNDNVADGAAIQTTTTNAYGYYGFSGLTAGNYIVGVIIPSGCGQGYIAGSGTDPDNDVDLDNNGVRLIGTNQAGSEVRSYAITLAAGTEPVNDDDDANGNQTLDIGLCPVNQAILKVGNFVWLDQNCNGMRDAGEAGLGNATVKLYKDDNNDNVADGYAIATTTTNSSGYYYFSGLTAGNYIVAVVIPTGCTAGYSVGSGTDPDNDVDNDNNGVVLVGSNQAGSEIRSYAITLAANTEPTSDGDDANSNFTLDFGLCPVTLKVGNFVWLDQNCNGIKDAGEQGIANATVRLYKDDNNDNVADGYALQTTTTNASGYYYFSGLSAGNYIVGVTIPSGCGQGYVAGTGTDPDNDVDNDNNGVVLMGSNQPGSEVRSYAITLAAGTEPTSDGDDANSNFTLDFGLCPAAPVTLKLGNFVWLDQNCNGYRDSNEPGIANATVNLYKDNNNDNIADGYALQTTTTNASGYYFFSNLTAGNYIVGVTIPSGCGQGYVAGSGTDPDNDVDNDNNGVRLMGTNQAGSEVRSLAITLAAGTEPTNDGDDANSNFTLDFGLCPAAPVTLKVGNVVWLDQNCNGYRDSNEPGIANATVKLYKDDNNDNVADGAALQTSTTNASGYYYFSNLTAGNYIVGVTIPSGCGQGYVAGSGTDPDNDVDNDNNGVRLIGTNQAGSEIRSYAITLAANTEPTNDGDDANSNFTLDFGLCPAAPVTLKVGNFVWLDQNCNGYRDAGEPGIANATVKLYKDDNNDNVADGYALQTATTDASGYYYFSGLSAGNYIVGVTIPSGCGQGYVAGTGTDPDNDVDNDNNGVVLIGSNQQGSEVRSYAITLAANTEPTNDGDDANSNFTLDFGLCPSAPVTLKLGNYVWLDQNCNGYRDSNEPGIANATVKLYKDDNNDNVADGSAIQTTTTNSSGYYSFSGLSAGNYIVGVVITTGCGQGYVAGTGTDPDNDVDNDNNGVRLMGTNQAGSEVRSYAITLAANTEPTNDGDDANSNFTLDFGLCPKVVYLTLGSDIWCDTNQDGMKGKDESGIQGVTVKLYKDNNNDNMPDGGAIMTTTTNPNGKYNFSNLTDGNYIIGVILPSGYYMGPVNYNDPDNNVDNDNNAYMVTGYNQAGSEVRTKAITLTAGYEPNGAEHNVNNTLDIGLKPQSNTCGSHCYCNNDCSHTGCGHSNCGSYNDLGRNAIVATETTVTAELYPNPASSFVMLKVNADKESKAVIRILDASGKTVYIESRAVTTGVNQIKVQDLAKLKSGNYTVQIIMDSKVVNKKLVVAND